MFSKGDKAVSKVGVVDKLSSGKVYEVSRAGKSKVAVVDNSGREFSMSRDKFEHYFDRVTLLPGIGDFVREVEEKRAAQPECDCGAWAIKDEAHYKWCQSLEVSIYA